MFKALTYENKWVYGILVEYGLNGNSIYFIIENNISYKINPCTICQCLFSDENNSIYENDIVCIENYNYIADSTNIDHIVQFNFEINKEKNGGDFV